MNKYDSLAPVNKSLKDTHMLDQLSRETIWKHNVKQNIRAIFKRRKQSFKEPFVDRLTILQYDAWIDARIFITTM